MEDILIGTTDRSILVFIPDPASTDGSGKTTLTHADLTVSYARVETDNDVTVTDVTSSLSTLSALTDAHTDWGVKEVSSTLAPGLYRLDVADAVFASGAWYAVVYVMITSSAAAAQPKAFKLVAYDALDGVRLGLTALPNAAADGAGGLPISDAGGLDLDAQIGTKINDILTDTGTTLDGRIPAALVGGRMDANVGAISADATAADNAEAFFDGTGYAGTNNVIPTVTDVTNLHASAATAAGVSAVETDTQDIQSRLPAALVSGRMDSNTQAMAAGVITSTVIAADAIGSSQIAPNAIGSSELATTAATEIAQTVLTEAFTPLIGGQLDNGDGIINYFDAAISSRGTSTLDAAGVRTAVGLGSSNLDTQLDALPTAAEIATALLATAVTQSNVTADSTITVMKALLAAWVQAAGDWTLSGTTLTLKNADGTTFRTFTLDSGSAPTSRT